MKVIWDRLATGWCRVFHADPMQPIHGFYRCSSCLRLYPVPWHEGDVAMARRRVRSRSMDFQQEIVALDVK
jgi:hypothetical protein